MLEGPNPAVKDCAAHNIKKSRTVRLARYTAKALNDTLKMDVVGKLTTDADGNNAPYKKAKLDDSIDSRSKCVMEDKDVGMAKESRLVAMTLSMSPSLDNCSICH